MHPTDQISTACMLVSKRREREAKVRVRDKTIQREISD